MSTRVEGLSKGQINRAGDQLREWITPGARLQDAEPDLIHDTFSCLVAFRTSFQMPLTKVVMGLRSFVRTEMETPPLDGKLPVGQRLKREPQIEQKLLRFPKMQLSRMQDIGGCRAILPGGEPEVAGVLERINDRWGHTVKGFKDYGEDPPPTGYRAIHVVVLRDDHLIEIQLRTPGQHDWAKFVERIELMTRFNLKDGEGPPEVLRYLAKASDGIALEEVGQEADRDFMDEFIELREQATPLIRAEMDR